MVCVCAQGLSTSFALPTESGSVVMSPIPHPSVLWKTRGKTTFVPFVRLNVFMSFYPSFPHPVLFCIFIFLPHFLYLVSHPLPNKPLSNNKRKQQQQNLAVSFKCVLCICCLFIDYSLKPRWQSIRNVVNPSFKSVPREYLFCLLPFLWFLLEPRQCA